MTIEEYGVNLRFDSIKILQYIDSMEKFFDGILSIRRIYEFKSSVYVNLVYSKADMEYIAQQRLPNWVIGMSNGKQIWILEKSKWYNPKMDLCQLVLHEFVHVATGMDEMEKEPIWIKEGMAVYLSGQFNDYNQNDMQIEDEFSIYNLSYQSENLYYYSSYMIAALVNEYGMNLLMNEVKDWKNSHILNEENLRNVLLKYKKGLVGK